MSIRMQAVAVSAFMTLPMAAAAEEPIRLQRFDAELRLVGSAKWDAGGEVRGRMIALPGGEFAALVDSAGGKRALVRWDERGKELQRVRVEVPGDVWEFARQKDGTYLLVTEGEVAKVKGDGKVVARQPLPDRSGETLPPDDDPFNRPSFEPVMASATEGGAWVGYKDQVVFVGLDGRTVTRKLPVSQPPEEQCKKEYGELKGCPYELRFGWLWGLEGGGCLVSERLRFSHDAGGTRLTNQAALTVLDGEGRSGAQTTLGTVRSHLEWFNFDSSGGSFLPGKFTLVRRSYEGNAALEDVVELPGGDLVGRLQDHGAWLVRLDRTLKVKWKRWVQPGPSLSLSPPWAKGIFLYSGGYFAHTFDEAGGGEREANFHPEEYDPSHYPSVANQSVNGEWLVVTYGHQFEPSEQ